MKIDIHPNEINPIQAIIIQKFSINHSQVIIHLREVILRLDHDILHPKETNLIQVIIRSVEIILQ
jgi:hypothetical protein